MPTCTGPSSDLLRGAGRATRAALGAALMLAGCAAPRLPALETASPSQAQSPIAGWGAEVLEVHPASLQWYPPSAMPPGAGFALVMGDPRLSGPYVYRLWLTANYRMPPHTVIDDRTYTVLQGTLFVGRGERFDEAKLKTLPSGSFYAMAKGQPRFGRTGGEPVLLQVTGTGPSPRILWVNPAEAPAKN